MPNHCILRYAKIHTDVSLYLLHFRMGLKYSLKPLSFYIWSSYPFCSMFQREIALLVQGTLDRAALFPYECKNVFMQYLGEKKTSHLNALWIQPFPKAKMYSCILDDLQLENCAANALILPRKRFKQHQQKEKREKLWKKQPIASNLDSCF